MPRFLLALTAAFLLAGCTVSTSKAPVKTAFDRKKECRDICSQVYEAQAESYKLSDDARLELPEFTYNQKLNTCLYRGEVTNHGRTYSFVRDCLSNKDLLDYSYRDGQLDPSTYTDFEAKADALMAGENPRIRE